MMNEFNRKEKKSDLLTAAITICSGFPMAVVCRSTTPMKPS